MCLTGRFARRGLHGMIRCGNRYGSSLRKIVKKIEISQHSTYTCAFCGKNTVKRACTGIWECKKCG
ncbi:hypothetical protein BLSTO_00733, partial [Blastocystis sp. subtype 1]